MARSYAQLKVSIWDDDGGFCRLTPNAKLLYIHLISRRDLSHAGHLYVREQRWADACFGGNTDAITDAITELIDHRYILIDSKTGELLVRTFIYHDGGWRNKKMQKAIAGAVDKIESSELSTFASQTLAKWVGTTSDQQDRASDYPSDHQYEDTSDETSDPTYTFHLQPTTLNLQPAAAPIDPPEVSAERKPNAAAAALKYLLDHKLRSAKSPGLRILLKKELPDEWREPIAAYIATRPDASPEEIAAVVLKVPGLTYATSTPRAPWYADPHCHECPGDGWVADSAGYVAACPCRRTDPYVATVTPIRPETA